MTKKTTAPPPFLTRKLSDRKKKLVRKYLPQFIDSFQKEKNYGLTSVQATCQFIRLLGTKHRDFRDIQEDQVCTTDPGTYEIYNAVRKRMQPLDEKPTQSTPA